MLNGITVLDLTQFLAGPFATQILGDLGADIIKIEWGEGDSTRSLPPYFIGHDSLYYLSTNRNKRSICLNLKNPAGRDVFLRMVAHADVVIDNFRPGVLDRLNLNAQVLREANPAIVTCSITGFGASGPLAGLAAYDMVVQALSGGMSLTGEPGRKPVRAGVPLGDIAAGLYAVIGILAELYLRAASGGTAALKHIDVAMLDCQLAMLSYQAAYALYSHEEPGPQGRAHRSIPTYGAFTCQDGQDVMVCANTEEMWRSLCKALDSADLIEEPDFATNALRLSHIDTFLPELRGRFLRYPARTVVDRLQRSRIPAALVNGVLDALDQPQARHRSMVQELTHSDGTRFRIAGDPLKLGAAAPVPRRPPELGEHTREVLHAFGYDDAAVDGLIREGAIEEGSGPPAANA